MSHSSLEWMLWQMTRNVLALVLVLFFFSSRRRHTRFDCDWSSDVCSSDLSDSGRRLPIPELACPHQAIVDGDAHCHSIAAASVIAKTVRDGLMERLAVRRSEERRVGKERRSRWSPYHLKKKTATVHVDEQ